jgi:hypothetical protein
LRAASGVASPTTGQRDLAGLRLLIDIGHPRRENAFWVLKNSRDPTMHSLLTLLTAAALTGHAFAGCCWRERATLGHDTGCANCQRDHAAGSGCCGSTGEESPAPCSCRLECRKLCQYVSPQRMAGVAEAGPPALLAILPPDLMAVERPPRFVERRERGRLDPQRECSRHRVLLI